MRRTLVDLFENSVKLYPDNPFLWEKTTDKFEPTTYTQVKEQVYTLGAGLVALGVKKAITWPSSVKAVTPGSSVS